ncbi:MAG: hypothetical protein Q4F70_05680, partial [Clostridia bacterium]|nr:hypothetical protein [Clostridia bacterium]
MNKRKSVAVQLINFISVLLIVGLTILFICSYIAMGKLAETEISKLTRTVTTFYTDLFVYGMQSTDVKETFDTQEIIDCGSYVCEWFNVDYAYVYEPDFENNTIKYVAVSKDAYIQNDEVDKNHYQGKVVEHKF